jgi:hypothetical protein
MFPPAAAAVAAGDARKPSQRSTAQQENCVLQHRAPSLLRRARMHAKRLNRQSNFAAWALDRATCVKRYHRRDFRHRTARCEAAPGVNGCRILLDPIAASGA